MASNDIDYEIIGEGVQFVEIALDPGETVITEAGAMIYMEDGISWEAKMGDGSNPDQRLMGKFFSAGKRMLAGESLFLTHFTSNGSSRKSVGFAGNIPGSIVGIDLSRIGGAITCQRDAFLCTAKGTNITVTFTKSLGSGFFGGEGVFVTTLRGSGTVLLQSTPASRMSQALMKNLPSRDGTGNKPLGNLRNIINRM